MVDDMLKGVAVSAGIGIGEAVLIREEAIDVVKKKVLFVEEEKQRFLDAVQVFIRDMQQAMEIVNRNVGPDEAAILGAHIAIIQDQELIKEVLRSIERQQVNAEYAFNLICNGYIALFSNLEDELISARAADFKDIRDRMLRILLGIRKVDLSLVPAGSILVAEDIPPSEAANIDTGRILGIITQRGTRFSHIAIIARALQLPAVVAVDNVFDVLEGGEKVIVDGHSGCVVVSPDDASLENYRKVVENERVRQHMLEQYRDQLTKTWDGKRVLLASNLAMEQELEAIRADNADGIGLFRTEFLYMDRKSAPGEEEQYETYRRIVQALEGKPVIIRTLDIGGDKDISYLIGAREQNPFLGHRGVRFCLDHPELFRTQLAALLRAAAWGDLRVMIPMISCITELRKVKALIGEVADGLRRKNKEHRIPLVGIMIETPAAVMCAEDLAVEADFFSIGTNDLTQYVLAVDRSNDEVATLYNTMHPAVLRMIAHTVQSAHRMGVQVGVCGEAAADPLLCAFLVGVGVDELSVSSGALLAVRSQVNNLSYEKWREWIPDILSLKTADEVRGFLTSRLKPPG